MDRKNIDEHFRYYLENENQFISAERYVYISKKCKETYSFVYANLLFNICSDFESLIRAYFNRENDNLIDIDGIIKLIESDNELKKVFDEKVNFARGDYGEMQPLKVYRDNKNGKKSFKWWSAYNKVKHNKVKNIFHAKQENILLGLASLYVLNKYMISIISKSDNLVDCFSNDNTLFVLVNLKNESININNNIFLTEI